MDQEGEKKDGAAEEGGKDGDKKDEAQKEKEAKEEEEPDFLLAAGCLGFRVQGDNQGSFVSHLDPEASSSPRLVIWGLRVHVVGFLL